ncbi:hypothetical protein BC829DRAFT_91590 [Chytridium lagenaria]|nr:hypothetical protein BC829DRAFT_91590 [Chytridium lagenaria]
MHRTTAPSPIVSSIRSSSPKTSTRFATASENPSGRGPPNPLPLSFTSSVPFSNKTPSISPRPPTKTPVADSSPFNCRKCKVPIPIPLLPFLHTASMPDSTFPSPPNQVVTRPRCRFPPSSLSSLPFRLPPSLSSLPFRFPPSLSLPPLSSPKERLPSPSSTSHLSSLFFLKSPLPHRTGQPSSDPLPQVISQLTSKAFPLQPAPSWSFAFSS